MRIAKVKKRNGSVADFDRGCIERAIEKACVATGAETASGFYSSITDDVTRVLEQKHGERTPGVEDIQDIVEMMLAERGPFDFHPVPPRARGNAHAPARRPTRADRAPRNPSEKAKR